MSIRKCDVCGATWVEGQLYWSGTNRPGRDIDLNALVCRRLPPEKVERCVNPAKGQDGGVGWEERMKIIEQGLDGL